MAATRDNSRWGKWNSANGLIGQDWQYAYKLVSDANNAIYNISSMTGITDAEKSQFLSEIRFCRAVAYSDLTDAFGPVILATEKDLGEPQLHGPAEAVSRRQCRQPAGQRSHGRRRCAAPQLPEQSDLFHQRRGSRHEGCGAHAAGQALPA
ncbi:RagB/SusD family nutrient uptake outer membrane protein [Puia sp. P3]|uniref:RagB/SusD family nutrient uptake outer membrane protein n=1 Tax=Puia sp. P3 TaxID=3423952 RepID=UPI003D6706A6